jgi:Rrf2 family transcriptional regulator, nitric oxide-sensitive transcriptional repressor
MHSQTAEYAMRAMACLAQYRELVATPTLADQTGVPANYLAKVLQMLAGAGLIAGRRGVGGGYRLSRGADDITLLQVVDAVDPLPRNRQVPNNTNGQSYGTLSALHAKMDEASQAVIRVYQHATLADLVRSEVVNRVNIGTGARPAPAMAPGMAPARVNSPQPVHTNGSNGNGYPTSTNGGRMAAFNGNGNGNGHYSSNGAR